jgi:hypothetical protein
MWDTVAFQILSKRFCLLLYNRMGNAIITHAPVDGEIVHAAKMEC